MNIPESASDLSVYPTDKHPSYHPLWQTHAYHGFYDTIRDFVKAHEIYDLWYDLLWKTLNIKEGVA